MLDVGGRSNDFIRRCCEAANDVLVVSTSEVVSVMDCYARIKTSCSGQGAAMLWLVVNQSDDEAARDVYQRIDQSCRRFLGFGVQHVDLVQ